MTKVPKVPKVPENSSTVIINWPDRLMPNKQQSLGIDKTLKTCCNIYNICVEMDRTIYEETGIGISANDLSNYMKDDNIACENLSSKFMLKNRKLSRAASDAGFSKFKQILGYEAFKHQTKVIFVNPKYTTQDCSVCRNRIKKDLSARVHECHY